MSTRAPSNSPQISDPDNSSVVPVNQPYMRKDTYDPTESGVVNDSTRLGNKTLSTVETERDNAILVANTPNQTHLANTSNPHGTTPTHLNLGNVDNTADIDKIVSSPTQVALDTKLNTSGGTITGPLVTTTVDGRDIEVDGTKLDLIEDSATRDQTATEILIALTTVDGQGSLLDADTLDGKELSTIEADRASDIVIANAPNVTHIADNNNPHGTTATHIGLGNVDNTSDLTKPISNATQLELDLKVNTSDTVIAGRDIPVDGTKLDSIESNATADQSPSEILSALITVDGVGSELDSEFLQGFTPASMPISNVVINNYPTNNDITSGTVNTNTIYHSGLDTGWIVPTLLNGWVPYGGGTTSFGSSGVRYRRYPSGEVELQIMVSNGVLGTAIMVLPVGFLPNQQLIFPGVSNNALSRVDIFTTGEVVVDITLASTTWLAHSIRYKAEA